MPDQPAVPDRYTTCEHDAAQFVTADEGTSHCPACEAEVRAWLHGYQDAQDGRGDFARRSYRHETGERAAYMSGRVAYHARKLSRSA